MKLRSVISGSTVPNQGSSKGSFQGVSLGHPGRSLKRGLVVGAAAIALFLGACEKDSADNAATNPEGEATTETVATPAPSTPDKPSEAVDPAASFSDLPRLEGKATVVMTVKGAPITIEVDGEKAPITAGNFVDLVQKGIYDGTVFHRVVRSPQPFVVQGGDPQGKDPGVPVENLGTGSYVDESGEPRYIPLEILPQGGKTPLYSQPFAAAGITDPPALQHNRGAVAMARSEFPDSASAQFYITLDNVNFLDGDYAVFGTVTDGMDVVDSIEQGDLIDSAKVTQGAENLKP